MHACTSYRAVIMLTRHDCIITGSNQYIDSILVPSYVKLVSSIDPTLEEGKGSGDFGQKLGPLDDLWRNLCVPLRLQL